MTLADHLASGNNDHCPRLGLDSIGWRNLGIHRP